MQETTETVEKLLDAFSNFEQKLGPILFQFPPYWPVDIPRLKQFIENLPQKYNKMLESKINIIRNFYIMLV